MAHKVMFKAPTYRQKDVRVFISKKLAKFFEVHKQTKFVNLMIKGLTKAITATMEEVKRQIQGMDAVYSGFMRSNIVGSVNTSPNSSGQFYGMIGTRAWYDILVHEGLGIHHKPPQALPAGFEPTAEQKAVAPSYAEVRKALGRIGTSRRGRGPRPFLTTALKRMEKTNFKIVSKAYKDALLTCGDGLSDVPNIPLMGR